MAPAACPSLHELEGVCEYCGEVCDSTQDELNAIACTFEGCLSPTIYHQHCIETYLKTIRLDKQRKTGFQCPRGCGKGSTSDKPCPGRVTKSHPIHARNDSSKKRRKAKMPEVSPPIVAPPVPAKKEKEEKSLHMNNSRSVKLEKDKDKVDLRSVPKPLVLNQASTFPSLSPNKPTLDKSVSVNCSSSQPISGVPKLLSRESTVAAIAAARSEIAASKRGGLKNNFDSYQSGRPEQSIIPFDSRSTLTSDTDDEDLRQLEPPKDFKKVLTVGWAVLESGPVPNAWTLGRSCNELLHGFKQKDLRLPTSHTGLLNSATDSKALTTTATARPPTIKNSADCVGLQVGDEDDLEARRLKARTKNEKKHLQRAARAREKREAEEAAAVMAATAASVLHNASQPKQSEMQSKFKPWSESFTIAVCRWKFLFLAKQLQEYGFADWQANMAIQMCGSDLEECLDWLLRNGTNMQMDMRLQHEETMDITREVNLLKEAMHSEGFTQEQVEVAIVSTNGDIEEALKHLRCSNGYWNTSVLESEESSQVTHNTGASPHYLFGQSSSQSSSDLAAGVWDSLNGTADGQDFSPLCSSANGSDSQRSFGPFAGGFFSDLAQYNSLLAVDNSQVNSGKYRSLGVLDSPGDLKSPWTTSASHNNVGFNDTFTGGCELTASTVTSVAAAVLNDTFGFDEQMISHLTEVIAANESSFNSAVNSASSLNGIWSYHQPSSTFSDFGVSKGSSNFFSADTFPYMSSDLPDNDSFFHARLGTFGNRHTPEVHDPAKKFSFKDTYSHSSSLGTARWDDHSVKVVDEAEEQELLMSQLLSQLLV